MDGRSGDSVFQDGGKLIDKTRFLHTLRSMTLLQARVEESTARKFARAAKDRGMTTYSYHQQVINAAAHAPQPRGWATHAADMAKLNTAPVERSVVAEDRAGEEQR
jgi:hypothetical protein